MLHTMKLRKTLTLLCLLGMAGSLFAQELSIKVNENGKAGYVDATGGEVVPCKYDAAYAFENGFGKVMKGEKFGLVDKSGTLVVPVSYDELTYDAARNIYRVKKGKKYGYLDGKGNVLLKPQYSLISPFNRYGKALIAMGGKVTADNKVKKNYLVGAKYGVLNADGTVAIPAKYKGLYEFRKIVNEGKVGHGAMLEKVTYYFGDTLLTDCKYMGFDTRGWVALGAGVLDENGTIVIKPATVSYAFRPNAGMARFYDYFTRSKSFNVGYIKLATQQKQTFLNGVQTDFNDATDFMDDIAAIAKNGVWNIVDRNLSIVNSNYKYLTKGTKCGLWCLQTADGKCDFFDTAGKPVFEGQGYAGVFFPRSEQEADQRYIAVKKDNVWGLIDRDNNTVLPFEYEQMTSVQFGWIPVKKGGKWGMQSVDGTSIVPTAYDDITSAVVPDTKAVYVKQGSLWYVYNIAQHKALGSGYKAAGRFIDGLAWARPEKFTVPDNMVYRSFSSDNSISAENFGYIIDNEGREIVSQPLPIAQIEEIRNEILKKGIRPLTQNETKNLLLKISVRSRHYDLNSQISEENWDY